jgi:hypothetical protein
MVKEDEQLRRAVERQASYRADKSFTSLGDVLSELVEGRISPQQTRFELITEAWSQLLPTELYQHCKIVDISGGRLKVTVDSPSYMYEMRLLSRELLRELAQWCPRARIKEIKLAVG